VGGVWGGGSAVDKGRGWSLEDWSSRGGTYGDNARF
jgi:hypothetical protein